MKHLVCLVCGVLVAGCGYSQLRVSEASFEREIGRAERASVSEPVGQLSATWSGAVLAVTLVEERVCERWDEVELEQGNRVSRDVSRSGWDYALGGLSVGGGAWALSEAPTLSSEKPSEDESSPQDAAYFWGVVAVAAGAALLGHGVYHTARSGDEERDVERVTRVENRLSGPCRRGPRAGRSVSVRFGEDTFPAGETDASGRARVSVDVLPKGARALLGREAGRAFKVVADGELVRVESAAPWYEVLHARALARVRRRDDAAGYRSFLTLFPHSGERDPVKGRVAALEWAELAGSSDTDGLRRFAEEHAGRPEANLARARGAAVEWAAFGASRDVGRLEAFIARHGRHGAEAQTRLAAVRRAVAMKEVRRARSVDDLGRIYQGSTDVKVRAAARGRARRLRSREIGVIRRAGRLVDNRRWSQYNLYFCGFAHGTLSYTLEMTGMGALSVLAGGIEQHLRGTARAERQLERTLVKHVSGVRRAEHVMSCNSGWYL